MEYGVSGKRLPDYALIILLAVISFGAYFNSLQGEFLIDDYQAILHDPRAHGLKAFFKEGFSLSLGNPGLWDLSHALIWHFSAENPFYYHLWNVLLHVLCTACLFLLCQALFSDKALSFLSGVIFALHPIHTEAVSWISGGHYIFSGLFFLLSFIFYIKSARAYLYLILVAVFFGLCALSGNSAVSLPALFLAYEVFFRPKGEDKTFRVRILLLVCLVLIAIIFLSFFFIQRNMLTRSIFYFRGPAYIIVVTKAFLYYLKILYLPLARGLYHPFAYDTMQTGRITPAFFVSLGALALIILTFFKSLRKSKPLAFAIALFFTAYLPYSNIIPVCNIISERYMYLPSAGFSIAIAFLFLKVWGLINKSVYRLRLLRALAIAAITLYLGSYAAITLKHNYDYRNLVRYWQTNIENFPRGYMAYNNLAGTFYEMGIKQQAITYCWVTLMINPAQPHVWYNLGNVYRDSSQYDLSRMCYQEAVKTDASFTPAHKALGELNKVNRKKDKR